MIAWLRNRTRRVPSATERVDALAARRRAIEKEVDDAVRLRADARARLESHLASVPADLPRPPGLEPGPDGHRPCLAQTSEAAPDYQRSRPPEIDALLWHGDPLSWSRYRTAFRAHPWVATRAALTAQVEAAEDALGSAIVAVLSEPVSNMRTLHCALDMLVDVVELCPPAAAASLRAIVGEVELLAQAEAEREPWRG